MTVAAPPRPAEQGRVSVEALEALIEEARRRARRRRIGYAAGVLAAITAAAVFFGTGGGGSGANPGREALPQGASSASFAAAHPADRYVSGFRAAYLPIARAVNAAAWVCPYVETVWEMRMCGTRLAALRVPLAGVRRFVTKTTPPAGSLPGTNADIAALVRSIRVFRQRLARAAAAVKANNVSRFKTLVDASSWPPPTSGTGHFTYDPPNVFKDFAAFDRAITDLEVDVPGLANIKRDAFLQAAPPDLAPTTAPANRYAAGFRAAYLPVARALSSAEWVCPGVFSLWQMHLCGKRLAALHTRLAGIRQFVTKTTPPAGSLPETNADIAALVRSIRVFRQRLARVAAAVNANNLSRFKTLVDFSGPPPTSGAGHFTYDPPNVFKDLNAFGNAITELAIDIPGLSSAWA